MKPCATVHLPFQKLEAMDLSFDLTVAPLLSNSGSDGIVIPPDAVGKALQFRNASILGGL
jgi:hypothetical protein